MQFSWYNTSPTFPVHIHLGHNSPLNLLSNRKKTTHTHERTDHILIYLPNPYQTPVVKISTTKNHIRTRVPSIEGEKRTLPTGKPQNSFSYFIDFVEYKLQQEEQKTYKPMAIVRY